MNKTKWRSITKQLLPLITATVPLSILAWITWVTYKANNLGFSKKTYWDWMELLIIPIVLAVGAWFLNRSERKNEREIAEKNREEDRRIAQDRRNQTSLEAYFDRMVELLIEYDLMDNKSEKHKMLSTIARTRTLAVLRSLDGRRKGQVIQFLHESGLIAPELVVVPLDEANLIQAYLPKASLSKTNLSGAILNEADLRMANLSGASLTETYLEKANLRGAVLTWANLSGAKPIKANLTLANLSGSDLRGANLRGADLSEADLRLANLSGADLTEADLSGANLTDANLRMVNLSGAKVTDDQLAKAKSLKDATLPDGTKMPDEATEDEQT
jgi:uncharacterized protein YjbI with pentapeptide repeats